MSKFSIKVKLQGLEIEVEGTKEDAPRIAQQVGKQISGLLQTPAVLASGNGHAVIEGDTPGHSENGASEGSRKSRRPAKPGVRGRTPVEILSFSHDSSQYGSPLQGWNTTQKAVWFLYVVGKQANVTQLTANAIEKNFNHTFRAAGVIQRGNIGQGLEKERLKGTNATVGADMSDGTAKYFLTQTGEALAQRLAKGEAVTTD